MSDSIYEKFADRLDYDFRSLARPDQVPPEAFARGDGDKAIWLLLAGRGFGKTFSGAQWVRATVEAGLARRIALVGPTASDVRDVMVSMILEISPPSCKPQWQPSLRSLTWPNGAQALAFSSEEPERIRGYGFEICWCDELCAWSNVQEAWDQLQFTMRRGKRPRQCITTTPKTIPLLQKLLKRDDVVITRGSTRANAANLSKQFLESITARYAGTRLGRQELDAEILLDVEGALWTHEMINQARAARLVPDLERVVVAVDASGAHGADDTGADSTGIVVAGKGSDGRAYVLADLTLRGSPETWSRAAVKAYHYYNCDRLVAERNYGGSMIEAVIRTADRNISFREVTASRGKVVRAEPVAALYEQGRVSHVGDLTALEAQMVVMTSQGYRGDGSPDRVDALVWALSDLMIAPQRPQFVWGGLERRSELDVARHYLNTDRYH